MKKSFKGKVSSQGKAQVYGAFSAFFRENPNKEFILTIEFPESGNEINMIKYFRGVIVTEFMKIFKKEWQEYVLPEEVERRLLSWSPLAEGGQVRRLESLSKDEFVEFIKNCKRIASQEFDHFIP